MLVRGPLRPIFIGATIALLFSTRAFASFHFQDIVEIYSNADGTIQFIEMRGTQNSQHLFVNQSFTSNSNTFFFPSNLPSSSTADRSWIMATSGFAALPGAVTPDYIIPDNFFSISGDTLTLVGGFFAPMTFGPGDLPTDGVLSLNKDLSTGTNSPTNFADETGSVNVPPLDPDDVFVDFQADLNGFGTQILPFDNLQDAIEAANSAAVINIEPGSTNETFADEFAISKGLRLKNNAPDGGPVSIGLQLRTNDEPSGFRSRTAGLRDRYRRR